MRFCEVPSLGADAEALGKRGETADPSTGKGQKCGTSEPEAPAVHVDKYVAYISKLAPEVHSKVVQLPVFFWPQTEGKPGAKSFRVSSRCAARLTVLCHSSSIAMTVQKGCSGTCKPRKNFRVLMGADGSYDEAALLAKCRELCCTSECTDLNWM